MSLHHNNQNPAQLYVGNNAVAKVYVGNTQIWPASTPPIGDGSIDINISRSTTMVAPDSVRFSVSFSSGVFPTVSGPASGSYYDPRMHDLTYLWDFGASEDGNWDSPVNVLPAWKNRRYAKGPWVSHVFRTPGTKTVSVMVINPATGENYSTSTTLTVRDPDTFYSASNPWGYSGCRTVCINPVGDSNFSGAPVGAMTINLNQLIGIIGHTSITPLWESNQRLVNNDLTKGPVRYLFKRGGTYEVAVSLSSSVEGRRDQPHIYFGDYGNTSLPKPVLVPPAASLGINYVFDTAGFYSQALAPTSSPDQKFVNLDIRGGYDPTVRIPGNHLATDGANAFYLRRSAHTVISSCSVKGFYGAWLRHDMSGTNESTVTPNHIHIDDTIATDLGTQYPIFTARAIRQSSFSVTGCRFIQNPDSHSVDHQSLSRTEDMLFTHLRGCDFFTNCFNNATYTINKTPARDDLLVNVHSCSFEGNMTILELSSNTRAGSSGAAGSALFRSPVFNAVIDGCVLVASADTGTLFKTVATGVTMRNSLFIVSTAPRTPSHEFYQGFDVSLVQNATYATIPQYVFDAPVKVYNNTFVYERTSGNNNSRVPELYVMSVEGGGSYANLNFSNNVVKGAWKDVVDPNSFSPLSSTVLWAPRFKGYKPESTFILNTTYATPPDSVKSYKPQSGSSAIDAATQEPYSYTDINGTVRSAPRNKGSWE